ncbi:MAG: 4Fe-4S dicluster domain-containing protein, partial [Candidatus Brocadiae bacterium]|nr:4Fe-4S dicluster domain-containing protein [Candidatus Brocadiia bacterium]
PAAKERDVGLFVMKVFGNSRLLRLTPTDEDRHPTVRECLRFALANDDLPVILTGAKSPEEIAENAAIVEEFEGMSEEEGAELRAFGDRLSRGYCYGCDYCMPCPAEIEIPRIMRILQYRERLSWEWPQITAQYRSFERNFQDCTDCGQCEERCPQNIPVREWLKKAHQSLGA